MLERSNVGMKKYNENSTVFVWFACIVLSLAIIYMILITSFEIVAYGDMEYFQQEYEKYGVAEDLKMEMEDIMYVTEEMMSYLRGNRENLIVETVVDGIEQEFFNESEISHMEDVRELFIAGIVGRKICIVISLIIIVILFAFKIEWVRVLSIAFQYSILGISLLAGILGYLFATDFYKYFEKFHKIFFEGDTWLFDPNTSLMINMLPEGLFYDMTLKIVMVFLILIMICFILCRISLYKIKKIKKRCDEKMI